MHCHQQPHIQVTVQATHPLHGHPLTRSHEDNGWACDGRSRPGGCRSGITGFNQSRGLTRWNCKPCNFDLCDKCLQDTNTSSGCCGGGGSSQLPSGPVSHSLHNHPLGSTSNTNSWLCDGRNRHGGCRTSRDGRAPHGAPRFRCTQGCDYDLCSACLLDGMVQSQPQKCEVSLRSWHGKHLCAEQNHTVVANRDAVGPWEKWHIDRHGNDEISLRSAHGKYLCAEGNHTVVANRDQRGAWETWHLEPLGGDRYALRSHHGKYLCAEGNHSVIANRDRKAEWETWFLQFY